MNTLFKLDVIEVMDLMQGAPDLAKFKQSV